MSKFKVGDKVYRLVDRKEANVLWEVSEIQVMKMGDKKHYNYILKAEGDFSAGAKYKQAFLNFEEYLELYKTPHERLLELGWVSLNKANGVLTYLLNVDGSLHPEIIELLLEEKRYYTTLRVIDLELAEVLVDYLKALENDS